MKHKYLSTLLCMAALSPAMPVHAQDVSVDYKKYPDFSFQIKPDPELSKSVVSRTKAKETRPARVNNAETPYFPPVFNQDGGSCGSASRIGYMFNYEINAFRGLDGSLEENQYPTHFTWLLTNSNSGKEGMAAANGIPNVPTYGGRTYSKLFGNQDTADPDFGWMQGYDKWYAAMCNRISRNANFPLSVEKEEGREAVKNWIWNHNGDTDFKAGGICGIGVASGGNWQRIPKTAANDENGVTNEYYVQNWGKTVDHALTIVGYDDRIEFDLDGNGIAGEADKDEIGAWIVVNSWGQGWCNKGFIYCPYKNAISWDNSDSYYYPEVYHVRKNYRPLRTFKITMEYSKRSEIQISAGISENLQADAPEKTVAFEHFKYAGDGNNDGIDAEVPMLGRWADGMHYEPMEFGYDVTDLSAAFDTRKPLKYFLVIESKNTASGNGKIHNCSLIDYEFDQKGIEFPFDIDADGVTVRNQGNKTIVSVIVPGESFNMPRNLVLQENTLSWNEPVESAYTLKGYRVFKDGTALTDVDQNTRNYSIAESGSGIYQVAALYDFNGETILSSLTEAPTIAYSGENPETNYVRSFSNSGFNIEGVFTNKYNEATVEYWIKPERVFNWNQQIGPGWGNFMIHTTNAGELVVGWSTGTNRITSPTGMLQPGKWAHIAVTVSNNTMTAYINGQEVGTITTGYSGLGGFGDLSVGVNSASGISGQMDEFRIWSTARSQREIQNYMYAEIQEPANMPGLLTEVKMSESEGLTDATGHYQISCFGSQTQQTDNSLLQDNRQLQAEFSLPAGPYYVGSAVQLTNQCSGNAVAWKWDITGATEKVIETENPSVVFNEAGEQTITLTVTDTQGKTVQTNKKITVEQQAEPVADFKQSASSVPVGEHISFINESTPIDGCRYEWSMPGADVETATTRNAAATYSNPGTYEVTLTVTNAQGSSQTTQTVHITEIAPQVDFSISPDIVFVGDKTQLTDESKQMPTSWKWEVSNETHTILVHNQNESVTMKYPGVYDVSLTAANEQGSNRSEKKRAIIVCNEDGKNGLNFTGGAEHVSLISPIKENGSEFTVEWWMYAKANAKTRNHGIGGDQNGFLIETGSDGALTVYVANNKVSTAAGCVSLSEWHHYAVVFNSGSISILKDGKIVASGNVTAQVCPGFSSDFRIGGSEAPMNAVIDEFRVWNKALTPSVLVGYANQTISDVADAEQSHKLSVYYQFNQSSGDVIDATSNQNIGMRNGFGPEGDAWSSSKGIFCLNTAKRTNITAQYLKNISMPFRASGGTVNTANTTRFLKLSQNTSDSPWILENTVNTENAVTGFHVDKNKGSALTMTTSWDGFASSISDHKAYQTIKLPAGYYVFGVNSYAEFAADGSYLVAAAGKGLPNTQKLESESLGYNSLSEKEMEFGVSAESEVSLGLLINMSGSSCLTLKDLYLEEKIFEEYGVPSSVDQPETALNGQEQDILIRTDGSKLILTTRRNQRVVIADVSGAVLFNGSVCGTREFSLQRGFYIVNGKKIMIAQ